MTTIDEAKIKIGELACYARTKGWDEEYTEAVNMAIEALEQEPCEDCIRRQAVLDYIYNDLGLGDEENGKDVERHIELERSYRFVKSLPPVSPQPKIELDC